MTSTCTTIGVMPAAPLRISWKRRASAMGLVLHELEGALRVLLGCIDEAALPAARETLGCIRATLERIPDALNAGVLPGGKSQIPKSQIPKKSQITKSQRGGGAEMAGPTGEGKAEPSMGSPVDSPPPPPAPQPSPPPASSTKGPANSPPPDSNTPDRGRRAMTANGPPGRFRAAAKACVLLPVLAAAFLLGVLCLGVPARRDPSGCRQPVPVRKRGTVARRWFQLIDAIFTDSVLGWMEDRMAGAIFRIIQWRHNRNERLHENTINQT